MTRTVILVTLLARVALGQLPSSESSRVPLSSQDVRVAAVPGATAATYLDLVVDPSVAGGDAIDVVSSSELVTITLVLPSTVEVTLANGAGLGYTVSRDIVTEQTLVQRGPLSPFSQLGTHTMFLLPPNTAGGVYRVKANSTGESAATSLQAGYISLRGVKVGVGMNSKLVAPGDPAVVTAYVFNGTTPVNSATVTATIVPPNRSQRFWEYRQLPTAVADYASWIHEIYL